MAQGFKTLYCYNLSRLFAESFAFSTILLYFTADVGKEIRQSYIFEIEMSYFPLILLFAFFLVLLVRIIMYSHNYYLVCVQLKKTDKKYGFLGVLAWQITIGIIQLIIIYKSTQFYV